MPLIKVLVIDPKGKEANGDPFTEVGQQVHSSLMEMKALSNGYARWLRAATWDTDCRDYSYVISTSMLQVGGVVVRDSMISASRMNPF